MFKLNNRVGYSQRPLDPVQPLNSSFFRIQHMSHTRRALASCITAVLIMANVMAEPAHAATAERNQTAPPQASSGAKSNTAANVTGFRSVLFGMTLDDATKAIAKDFRISANDIGREQNQTERTNSLIVRVDDLQVGAGPAAIAYVFGYSSKRLFQVNILWGGAVNPKIDPNALIGAANSLRNYFVSQGYQPEGMVLNTPVGDGSQVVVFRGVDAQGRMALLNLSVPAKPAGSTPAAEEPPFLQLSYIEKPGEPDVFKIEKGF
jgi:hypothetical protein